MANQIEKVPAKVVIVKYKCTQCIMGHMVVKPNAPVLLSSPPLIRHSCDWCNHEMALTKKYPYNEITEA